MNEHLPTPDADLSRRLGLNVEKRRFWSGGRVFLALILVFLAAGSGGFYFWSSQSGNTGYVTSEIQRGPLVVTVSATGTLQPENQVDVGAEISGRVDSVVVDYNDKVAKGQVLALINTDQIRAQLAQSQAALSAALA